MLTRPQQQVAELARRYPGIWKAVDGFRASRGRELPEWPGWRYLPLAGAHAIASSGKPAPLAPREAAWVGRIGALAAWRPTQGIYRYDPELLEGLWTTPLAGELPVEFFFRLPEWCVYLELGGRAGLHGAYAHLEWDANDGRCEVRFLLDPGDGVEDLLPVPLHLVPGGSLHDAAQAAQAETARQARNLGFPTLGAGLPMDEALSPMVSLLLYLCSEEPDVRDGRGSQRLPRRPVPTRTKKGLRLFPPNEPTVWETGFRLGAALRQAASGERSEGAAERAGPRPHIRRAHWHTFWTGPKAARKISLRWLPPIPVGLEDIGKLRPTVRRVQP
ncbi:MAG: hypothetical protein P1P84_15240 [Deferrisomatales bacterium]|nr:hypothetical protein [Deferrisomatales bacterium]